VRLAQIGFGGIGKTVARCLRHDEAVRYVAVAARPWQKTEVRDVLGDVAVVETPEALLAEGPDIVAECAGHDALRQYAEPVLATGTTFIAVSVGVLADAAFRQVILKTAAKHGSSMQIPSGAIGGVDVVAAARHAGLQSITYVTRKAPPLWKNTAAEAMVDLDDVSRPVLFFEDTAERAATLFAEKANVTATLALAGIGFEKTGVQFWADHDFTRSTHLVELVGATGTMRIELANTVSPVDKKSSWLTAMSIVQSIRNRQSAIRTA
jgi:aspartate dehydrogenase